MLFYMMSWVSTHSSKSLWGTQMTLLLRWSTHWNSYLQDDETSELITSSSSTQMSHKSSISDASACLYSGVFTSACETWVEMRLEKHVNEMLLVMSSKCWRICWELWWYLNQQKDQQQSSFWHSSTWWSESCQCERDRWSERALVLWSRSIRLFTIV